MVDNADAISVDDRARPSVNEPLRDRDKIRPPSRYEVNLVEHQVPATFQEAVTESDASKWIEAIKEELKAHGRNKTWTIVPRVPGKKTIDSKWVLKILRDTSRSVHRFKARLCA